MNYRSNRGFRLLLPLLMVMAATIARGQSRDSVNAAGNVYIADQFNNRVIEVDQNGNIVWQYGDGSSVAGPTSVVAPNDAERVGELTLISGTGAPAGAEPSCPVGCPDNRVLLVMPNGQIFWQYGQAGVTGSGANQLNTPVCAVQLPDSRDILITDQGNQRVIEVNGGNQIVWQYGTTGVSGSGPNQLNSPNSAELLANGNILIADLTNNRVIEVNRNNQIEWSYGSPNDTATLNGAAFASRLSNGNTLITDAGNNRIIEINPSSQIVFEYLTANCGTTASVPTRAVRLQNGDTLVSGQFNDLVVEVDSSGTVVRTIGTLCVPGSGQNQLNAPYDAKVVGDYTGLTPPAACTPDTNTLCLNNGRFLVRAQWTDFQGNSGLASVVPGVTSTDSGVMWFFGSDNWELLIKVLNGCGINGHYWVFGAASTNVAYTITVTDTATGTARNYTNLLGTASPAITDTAAFPSCP